MEREKTLIINAPIDRVYDMWIRSSDYPKLLSHVKEVTLTGPTTEHWKVELAGMPLEFDIELTDVQENRHLAWKSISGIENSGFVHFEPVPEGTKVTVHFNFLPELYPPELAEKMGAGGIIENQIQEDLDNLKSRIESMAKAA
ncbi:MAG: SRPBCC family protein [Firmicutes bacterium]|nr:SRPBCC family protein [Bacillota bacterium]